MNKNQSSFNHNKSMRVGAFIAIWTLAFCLPLDLHAAFLSVDFNRSDSPNQAGFQPFVWNGVGGVSQSVTYTTTGGELLTVSLTNDYDAFFFAGAPPNNPPAFTYSDLYTDGVVGNPSFTFTLSGPAIHPGVLYDLTFYGWVDNASVNQTEVYSPIGNTSGTPATEASFGGVGPFFNGQYAAIGQFSAPDNSLEFRVSFNNDLGGPVPRALLNGFEIAPEPSAATLLGLTGLALLRRRNRA